MSVLVPPFLMQRELFSACEARAAGLDPSALRAAVKEGQLTRLKRGWYTGRATRYPQDRHRLMVRAEQQDSRHTVASHYSAAVLLGLPVHQVDWRTVHLMSQRDGQTWRRPGLTVHQRRDDRGPTRKDCVSVALACVQTALLDPVSGLMAADHALRHALVERPGLDRVIGELRGMRGARAATSALQLASATRQSPKESHLAFVLHTLGHCVVEQVKVATSLGVFYVDFQIRGSRVLLEYDGETKYAEPGALVREKLREDALRALGYDFVRVTKHTLDDVPALDAQIRRKLQLDRARCR